MKLKRRRLFGAGLILIFAGIIVFSYSNMAFEVKNVRTPNPQTVYNSWNVTRYFNENETLILDIPYPKHNPYNPVPYAAFNISIVAENGKKTVFLYDFSDGSVKVRVISNDGALEVNESAALLYVTGVTAFSGNYTAYIDESAAALYGGPPRYLTLKSLIEETSLEYPYRKFLPVGVLLICFGSSVSLLGFREPKRVRKLARTKKWKKWK